jgi:uncharacterized protein with GYD domain
MWQLTDEGIRDSQAVKASIRRASQMVQQLKGRCRLYVAYGDGYDLIGVAEGITDEQASALRHAVNALGHFHTTTFVKARDFSLDEFDGFADMVTNLVSPPGKPAAR